MQLTLFENQERRTCSLFPRVVFLFRVPPAHGTDAKRSVSFLHHKVEGGLTPSPFPRSYVTSSPAHCKVQFVTRNSLLPREAATVSSLLSSQPRKKRQQRRRSLRLHLRAEPRVTLSPAKEVEPPLEPPPHRTTRLNTLPYPCTPPAARGPPLPR